MRVVSLHRYAVKSLGGEDLPCSRVEPGGLTGDRRWMVVTPQGRFLTRREVPAMALVGTVWHSGALDLVHVEAGACRIAEPDHDDYRAARVWGDVVMARDAGDAAADWLTRVLARPVRLVHIDDTRPRRVDPRFGRDGDRVGFADGFPLLITLVESLDALNARLADPIAMARFRPNVVIAGAPAFAEDGWTRLRIGAALVRVVKPCTRCVITTQDPGSGVVTTPMEPLRTLKTMGRVTPGTREPVFGQNAIPDAPGTIAVGDAVEVL